MRTARIASACQDHPAGPLSAADGPRGQDEAPSSERPNAGHPTSVTLRSDRSAATCLSCPALPPNFTDRIQDHLHAIGMSADAQPARSRCSVACRSRQMSVRDGTAGWISVGRCPRPAYPVSVLAQGALAPDDRIRNRRGWQPVQAGPSPGAASLIGAAPSPHRGMSGYLIETQPVYAVSIRRSLAARQAAIRQQSGR